MEVPDMGELEEFLRASQLCDLNHPLVKATAAKITERAEIPKDATIQIFYFVRDKIPLAIAACARREILWHINQS